jgi:cell division protein FtsW (lipid II flippase)
LLCVVGLVFVFAPTLVTDAGPAPDTFEAIERRVRWGALGGLGALLVARTSLRPWSITLGVAVFWLTAGFLAARLIGLLLDGMDSGRQWMWVGVEALIVIAAWAFVARRSARASGDG